MRIRPSVWHIFALLSIALLLSGCLQPASVDRCTSSSDRPGCLTFYATWYQEPETCYFINDMDLRVACLNQSTDTAASQRLQETYAAYGQMPTTRRPSSSPTPTPSTPGTPSTPVVYVSPSSPTVVMDKAIAACVSANPKSTSDLCAKQLALDGRNLTYCSLIVSPDLRSSCILTTATNVKDASQCASFNSSSDRQFCVYYSRGS